MFDFTLSVMAAVAAFFWQGLHWFSHTSAGKQFLWPGLWLWPFGEPAGYSLLAVAIFSWWAWISGIRVAYAICGRTAGVYSPEVGAFLLRLSPPWRFFYRYAYAPVAWLLRQLRRKTGANSGWASLLAVLVDTFRPGDSVPLGRADYKGLKLWQTVAYRGPLHVNIIGPSGSGKSATLTGILGTLPRRAGAFFIDCDAAIINALGDWFLRKGHRVVCLDPNHLSRFPRGGWNAIAEFDAVAKKNIEMVPVFAKALGEGLVKQENFTQPTFDNGGRDFLVASSLFCWLSNLIPPEKKNLVTVRQLLTAGLPTRNSKEEGFRLLLFEMMEMAKQDDGCGGRIGALIARGAHTMLSGQNQQGGNPFRGSAMRATSWLDLPGVAELCERSDFVCADLKTTPLVVAVVAPLMDIRTTYSGLIRALTVMIATAFQNIPGRLKTPVSMCLDEANSLGRLDLLEFGSPAFRKYGIRLNVCFQDLPAIAAKSAYPDTWKSILSNAGVNAWLGATELDTLRYISDTLGKETIREKVEGTPWYAFWVPRHQRIKTRYQNVERLLMDPQQVKDYLNPEFGRMIVTGKGRPRRGAIDPYWEMLPIFRYSVGDHGETFLRACTRRLIIWASAAGNSLRKRARAFGEKMEPRAGASGLRSRLTYMILLYVKTLLMRF